VGIGPDESGKTSNGKSGNETRVLYSRGDLGETEKVAKQRLFRHDSHREIDVGGETFSGKWKWACVLSLWIESMSL